MWDRPRRSPAASSTRSTSSRQAHPMPSPLRPSVLAVIVSCAAAFAGSGCDNTITSSEALPPLEMASLDSNAGSWRMIVLSGPTQFAVAAPVAETSAAYAVELAAIRTAQANLTAAQRNSIAFWAGGGVLRWNQIERELVARFNLPPAPRPDGTYPVPDPENPFADPQLPFANPPYGARAYSYVAVAQYEALKTAWYWKYQFHRRSPARIDGGIRALMPVGELPAYPSEDAVLSGVTVEMLKVLFPAGVAHDVGRGHDRASAGAPIHLVGPNAAGIIRGEADGRPPYPGPARHRLQVERRRGYLYAAGPLERRRSGVRARRAHERGPRRSCLRAAQRGDARCRSRLLGRQVYVFQSPSRAARSGHYDGDRATEFPGKIGRASCRERV